MDHLLVMLILYRCHITQDFLGLLYGVDKATICRALRRIEPMAKRTFGVKRAIRVTEAEAQATLRSSPYSARSGVRNAGIPARKSVTASRTK
jgi:hypothetical protein